LSIPSSAQLQSSSPAASLIADLTVSNADRRAKVDQLIAEQRKAREVGDIGEIENTASSLGATPSIPLITKNFYLVRTTYHGLRHWRHHERPGARRARLRVRQKYSLEVRLVILPLANDPEETVAEPPLPYIGQEGMLITPVRTVVLNAPSDKKMSAHAEKSAFGKATITYA